METKNNKDFTLDFGYKNNLKIDYTNVYFAHQNTSALDEIQRMSIAYLNKHPLVLAGSPGSGKNHAISTLAKAIGKDEYRIRCTEEMTVRDIVGGDKLGVEKNHDSIATTTNFYEGKLMYAMKKGHFLILDEFNQLLPTVQKGLNSALEDIKTIDSLEGGHETKALDRFGLFITYNPDTGIAREDIESAVRDRCKVINFSELPTILKTYIALIKTGSINIKDLIDQNLVTIRGINKNNDDISFADYDGVWVDHRTRNEIAGEFSPYLFFDIHKSNNFNFSSGPQEQVYRITKSIVQSLDQIEKLRTRGTLSLEELTRKHELMTVGKLNLIPTSPRIINKLVEDYDTLKKRNVSLSEITSDIVLSIIDYTVPFSDRNELIGENITISNLVQKICVNNGLLTSFSARDIRERVLNSATQGAINAFINFGYSRDLAKTMVSEYLNINNKNPNIVFGGSNNDEDAEDINDDVDKNDLAF